jgi:hypothetical protein
VQRVYGLMLEPEVRIIGEPADTSAAAIDVGGSAGANGGRH